MDLPFLPLVSPMLFPSGLGSGGILRQESGIDGHCAFLELLLESPS